MMTVGELKTILSVMPDDLNVKVSIPDTRSSHGEREWVPLVTVLIHTESKLVVLND